jgi:hypothetical protein
MPQAAGTHSQCWKKEEQETERRPQIYLASQRVEDDEVARCWAIENGTDYA